MSGDATANDRDEPRQRIVLERCPLCGSREAAVIAVSETTWVRCGCGLVYKRSEAADAPAQGAGDALGHYDAAYFDRYDRWRGRRVRKARAQILDALEHARGARLLDVGCSLGSTLEAARMLGLDGAGVDVSEHALQRCRELGFDARKGTLESIPWPDGSIDVAVLKHVFEHTPRPRAALAELRRVLAPDGVAFFALPNATYAKAAQPERSRFFRGEAGRAHFVYYSPDTMTRLLSEERFRVVRVHPCLLHHRASAPRRMLEAALLPLRSVAGAARTAARLRKEFWLVATRN